MDQLVVALISGVLIGGTFALVGVGMVLVFRATDTLNFAQGQMMLLGAFIVARWQATGAVPWWLGLLISMLIVGGVGVVFYFVVLQRMIGLSPFMGAVATLGLAAILNGVITLIFGAAQYRIDLPLPDQTVTILGARVSVENLILAAVAFGIALLVAGLLRFTHLGTRVRAAGQNATLASQGGIQVRRIYMGSWLLAGALATLGGTVYGTANIVDPSIVVLGFSVFPAIAIGGLDSVEGAIVGGLLVGVGQSLIATYLGSDALDLVTYGALLVVLLLMPNGLFGTPRVRRL